MHNNIGIEIFFMLYDFQNVTKIFQLSILFYLVIRRSMLNYRAIFSHINIQPYVLVVHQRSENCLFMKISDVHVYIMKARERYM